MKHLAARTKFDIIIDESSNKPGEQSFEKMIAGLYLGEVFRLVLTELIESGHMFLGQNTYKLEKAYAVDTAFLSLMERWVRRQEHTLGISVADFVKILVATPLTSSSPSSESFPTSSVSRPPWRSESFSETWPS